MATQVTAASSRPLAKIRKKPPKRLDKVVEAVDRQTIFQFGYLILSAFVQFPKVSIEVVGDDRAKKLAENLTEKWKESLKDALDSFKFGRACFEKTYYWDPVEQLHKLHKLTYLPYENTTLQIDEEGCFAGVELKAKDETVTLYSEEVWWFALDGSPVYPDGRSRYRGAVLEVWGDLEELDCNEQVWLKRFALGHGFATAPDEYPDQPIGGAGNVDQLRVDSTPKDPMQDFTDAINSTNSGGVVVASSKHEDGHPLFTYTPIAGQHDRTAIGARRAELREDALMSLGIAPRSVMQAPDAVGSYGMAETHKDVTVHTAQVIHGQLMQSFQKYVINKAVEINCPGAKLTLVSQPIDNKWIALILNLATQAVSGAQLSPILGNGIVDLPKLFEVAGIPVGEHVSEKLQKLQDQFEKMQTAATPLGLPMPGGVGPAVNPAAGATDVAGTALNGAQISSLVEIIQQVSAGQLPLASAKPILEAAFPTLPPEVLDRIVRPVLGFTPTIQASIDASTTPPQKTWEQIAEEAIKGSLEIVGEIKDLPQSGDAPVLLRQDS